jgi:hypothetical protein
VTLVYGDRALFALGRSPAYLGLGAVVEKSRLHANGGVHFLHLVFASQAFVCRWTVVRATMGPHMTPANLSPRMTRRKPAWNESQFTKPKLTRPVS